MSARSFRLLMPALLSTLFVAHARAQESTPDAGALPPAESSTALQDGGAPELAPDASQAPGMPEPAPVVPALSPPGTGEPALSEPAPPTAEAVPPPPARVQEVRVRGRASESKRLKRSAEAVTMVDARRARRESAELGEVLARVPGISVRRAGGLGSDERVAMGGLSDDQVRTFIDGVPLELAFFPFGLSSFPVSLVDRVEIYKGVVPIRFGADALGGAINLVSDRRYETGASGSYELGGFGTTRVTLGGAYRHDASGLVANAQGFYDHADNDYDVDVEVADARGRLSPARVPRFHDGYRARGVTVEAGVVDQPWARRLLLRGYAVGYEKELQHNTVMTVPYGEVEYGETAAGATARYQVQLRSDLELTLIASYSYRSDEFTDQSEWVYDWYGERINDRLVPGEIDGQGYDQTRWTHGGFARALVAYSIAPEHVITLASSAVLSTTTGEDRTVAPGARDPLAANRNRLAVLSGVEYEANFFALPDAGAPARDAAPEPGTDYRLQNIAFVKDYVYHTDTRELLPGMVYRERDTDSHTLGAGDGVRYRFNDWLIAKVSYEYATRLPSAFELFGDGLLLTDNLELEPEVSHNANLGPQLELKKTPAGDFDVELTGFFRDADKLIVLLGNDRFFSYQNVYSARSLGVEGALTWSSPGKWVALDASATFQDFRNSAQQGAFREFDGDRIPNRPWLFASWGARLHFAKLIADDELEPFYVGRYVNEYFRGWESQGLRAYKQTVDAQMTHGAGISYVLELEPSKLSATLELQNIGDAKVYDFYGVQRPGRSLFLKVTADVR